MTHKAKRERSKNLNDDSIEKIVEILDGWSKKLTWDDLINEIDFRLKERYTRQTLAKHARIKSAFNLTKKRISARGNHKSTSSVEVEVLIQQIERVEAENARLKKENQDLLAQFSRWSYNSYLKGVTEDELDKPLPMVDRR
ncbi:hypothetical protein [Sulfurovum sp. TSL1]|uniref:hypothetical protein n=1 Tax=Sulfurovum sp. TSL1 TaxID=2826994 RepID=UPI001CC59B06|nr:hypothetical protein [Sulfurovum sp. TSL1]GIT99121.1 hypothetical protein TSL1_19420 [Sulfurovum sp. TSL1]